MLIKEYFFECPHCSVKISFIDAELLETKVACPQCQGKTMLPDMLNYREVDEKFAVTEKLEIREEVEMAESIPLNSQYEETLDPEAEPESVEELKKSEYEDILDQIVDKPLRVVTELGVKPIRIIKDEAEPVVKKNSHHPGTRVVHRSAPKARKIIKRKTR